ncbi:hypothetical protein GGTG_13731, partial [Gaeumannomyces tritici R3-111a-1]
MEPAAKTKNPPTRHNDMAGNRHDTRPPQPPQRHDAGPAAPSAAPSAAPDGNMDDVAQACRRGLSLLSDLAAEAVAARPAVVGGPVERARARLRRLTAVGDALESLPAAAESLAALLELCETVGMSGAMLVSASGAVSGRECVVPVPVPVSVREASLRRRKTRADGILVTSTRPEREREKVVAAVSDAVAELRAVVGAFSGVEFMPLSTAVTIQSLLGRLSELATAMGHLAGGAAVLLSPSTPHPRTTDGYIPRAPSSSLAALALQVQHVHHPFQALGAPPPTTCRSAPDSALSVGTLRLWTDCKAVTLAGGCCGGYRSTALLLAAALLLNHARRVLLPWLGAYVHAHPVESLRVARSRPDLLVEETLAATDGAAVAFMYCQRAAFDAAGAFLMARYRRTGASAAAAASNNNNNNN